MTSIAPTAQPGDICVLIEPSLEEKLCLYHDQLYLQTFFGGTVCAGAHVTCQRFSVPNGHRLALIIPILRCELSTFAPFAIFADSLMSFYAEFWQSTVLRWRVQNTEDWICFKRTLETLLTELGCPPHYPPLQAITCTALEGVQRSELPPGMAELFPYRLFDTRRIVLSQITGPHEFNILSAFDLPSENRLSVRMLITA